MEFSDSVLSLFSAQAERNGGSHVVKIPEQELEVGPVSEGEVYRVALLPAADADGADGSSGSNASRSSSKARDLQGGRVQKPPVVKGELRDVEIEDMGDKGDGIARIGPGYIVFVEGTTVGDRVKIRITEAQDNFAFGEVVEHV